MAKLLQVLRLTYLPKPQLLVAGIMLLAHLLIAWHWVEHPEHIIESSHHDCSVCVMVDWLDVDAQPNESSQLPLVAAAQYQVAVSHFIDAFRIVNLGRSPPSLSLFNYILLIAK